MPCDHGPTVCKLDTYNMRKCRSQPDNRNQWTELYIALVLPHAMLLSNLFRRMSRAEGIQYRISHPDSSKIWRLLTRCEDRMSATAVLVCASPLFSQEVDLCMRYITHRKHQSWLATISISTIQRLMLRCGSSIFYVVQSL